MSRQCFPPTEPVCGQVADDNYHQIHCWILLQNRDHLPTFISSTILNLKHSVNCSQHCPIQRLLSSSRYIMTKVISETSDYIITMYIVQIHSRFTTRCHSCTSCNLVIICSSLSSPSRFISLHTCNNIQVLLL